MRVLIFGGTRFMGRQTLSQLHHLGVDITYLSRKRLPDDPSLSPVIGERSVVSNKIENTFFDVVLDFTAYQVADVQQTLSTVKTNHYILISSAWITQKETGSSSWFGFSMIIKPGSKRTRDNLVNTLSDIGFECRPIVAGNFVKNNVVNYFNYEVNDILKNANWIDENGLFIGNHHVDMKAALDSLTL